MSRGSLEVSEEVNNLQQYGGCEGGWEIGNLHVILPQFSTRRLVNVPFIDSSSNCNAV